MSTKNVNMAVNSLVQFHQISDELGFLPKNPLRLLPSNTQFMLRNRYFIEIDKIAYSLPDLIKKGRVAEAVRSLPVPSWPIYDLYQPAMYRLMLLVTMLEHAYFYEKLQHLKVAELMAMEGPHVIPNKLAIPLYKLWQQTGIAPSMSYELYSQWNYLKFDPSKPIDFDNIKMIHSFTDTEDEKGFVLIHQIVDYTFAPVIRPSLKAHLLTADSSQWDSVPPDLITRLLEEISANMEKVVNVLERMREYCRPDVYFEQVRRFYSIPRNLEFEGVEKLKGQTVNVLGETGGQDSWKQFMHAILGMDFDDVKFGNIYYFKELRNHMSPVRRNLVERIKSESMLRNYVVDQKEKNNCQPARRYNRLIKSLLDWMDEHYSLAKEYVGRQGETHGTVKAPFGLLQEIRDKTKSYIIE